MSRDVCPECQSPDDCDCGGKETLCCDAFWQRCDSCEDGLVETGGDTYVIEWESCDVCEGGGGWWHCDCDENGLHSTTVRP